MTIHLTHVCVYLSAPSLLIFYCFPIHVKHVNFELACEKQKQRHNRTVARIRFTIDNDPLVSRIFHSIHAATTTLESLWPNTKSRGRCLAHISVCCGIFAFLLAHYVIPPPPSLCPINATKSSTQTKPKVFSSTNLVLLLV